MKEYKDPEVLKELHWDLDMSLREIGEEYEVSHKTISYWFEKHDIPKRGVGGEYPYARFKTIHEESESAGYEEWRTKHKGDDLRVKVHRLVAVAEFGIDAVKGMTVHHQNEVKWDNRGSNIELLENSDHAKLHHEEREDDFWAYREEVSV